MAELPSSQANNLPPIFRQENGDPLRLFVEACSILNRPRLVRTLKKAGAEICIDPRQAQIILVDPRTDDGRKFIRDWSGDMDKVVLDHGWVAKSLAAGRALGEVDQWGDCLTQDDGLPLDADAGFDDEPEQEEQPKNNPLPTPRVTPVETTTAKGKGPRKSQAAANVSESSSSPNAAAQNDVNHTSTIPTTSTAESPALMTPESFIFQNASSSSTNGFPAATSADTHFPTTPVSQYDFPGVQPFQPNPAPFIDFVQQSMQPAMTQPVNFMQPVTQQPGMMPMPMQLWQMMSSMFSQSAAQVNSDRFAMSLMDAMRNYGVVPYPQATPPVPGLQQPPMSMPRSPSPRLSPSISRNARDSTSGFPPQVGRRSGRRPRSPAPPAFSTPQPLKQKRGEKSPENRRQTIASVGSSRPPYTVESPTKKPKLFVKGNEQPISFFVQIDQPHRLNLVTLIKKNGGKIDSSQTTADYAILYSQSKTFNDLLKSAMEAGKTAVSAPFIHDSVEAGILLNSEKYKLKVLKKSKKRGVQGDSSSDVEELTPAEAAAAAAAAAAEQQRLAQSQRKQKKRAKVGGSASSPDVARQEGESAFGRPRVPSSPIPPSPESEQFNLRGRAKYSDLEREYALKYIKVLLERDHLMPASAMANQLYRKLPHHTLKSWTSYISNYNMREEIDMIRKKAGNAYRKALSDQKKPPVVKEEPRDLDLNDLAVGNTSQTDMEDDRRRDEEEDLNIICDFFVYGGDDEQGDRPDQEQLWRRLASKAKCKTAPSWVEFYNQHYNVIEERYSKLVGAPQPTQPPT